MTAASKPGDVILDLFAGSCTVGRVFIEGSECDYWLAKRFEPKFNPGASGNRLSRVAPKWLRLPETWGTESDTVYCSLCKDFIPCDDVVEDACEHISWDFDKGWWAGEGYDEGIEP